MKQQLIALLFLVLSVGLFAQTGLFDISFMGSYAETKASLESWDPAFELVSYSSTEAVFESPTNEILDHVELYLRDNKIRGWTIYFDEIDEFVYDDVYDSLVETHGEDGTWSDEFDMYSWNLGYGHSVSITTESGQVLVMYMYLY